MDQGDHDLVDRVSEGLLKSVIAAGRKAIADPQDYDARATLMLAGSWSHNGMTGAGCKFVMNAHKLEHEMSAVDSRIAHGAGLAVVWPAYLEYIHKGDLARFVQYAERIWDVEPGEPEAVAMEGIRRTRAYFNEIGMPATLCDVGLSKDDIAIMADKATNGGKIVFPLPRSHGQAGVYRYLQSLLIRVSDIRERAMRKIRVGVAGYGTIGQRLADGVALQGDMELVGVADLAPTLAIRALHEKGIALRSVPGGRRGSGAI